MTTSGPIINRVNYKVHLKVSIDLIISEVGWCHP
jgi:hypothetical protein